MHVLASDGQQRVLVLMSNDGAIRRTLFLVTIAVGSTQVNIFRTLVGSFDERSARCLGPADSCVALLLSVSAFVAILEAAAAG